MSCVSTHNANATNAMPPNTKIASWMPLMIFAKRPIYLPPRIATVTVGPVGKALTFLVESFLGF